jgi:hypothetical protein
MPWAGTAHCDRELASAIWLRTITFGNPSMSVGSIGVPALALSMSAVVCSEAAAFSRLKYCRFSYSAVERDINVNSFPAIGVLARIFYAYFLLVKKRNLNKK